MPGSASPPRYAGKRPEALCPAHKRKRDVRSDRGMDLRRHAPAAERNRAPILAVLSRVLPQRGLVLEISSGTGQHVAHFAAALTELVWQPSELDEESFPSIVAWTQWAELSNVRPPLRLDVIDDVWPIEGVDAILNAN